MIEVNFTQSFSSKKNENKSSKVQAVAVKPNLSRKSVLGKLQKKYMTRQRKKREDKEWLDGWMDEGKEIGGERKAGDVGGEECERLWY